MKKKSLISLLIISAIGLAVSVSLRPDSSITPAPTKKLAGKKEQAAIPPKTQESISGGSGVITITVRPTTEK